MGAYLSTPCTEKKSEDFAESEKFSYGVSRMQGWRIAMEDAHNCVPDLTENSSMFGVYDGHGGSEVALYCALHISDVLKDLQSFKDEKYETALQEAFMSLDKRLLDPDVIRELKVLADRDLDTGRPSEEEMSAAEKQRQDEEECEEDEMAMLHEEATMSIEELLARYGKVADETKKKLEERNQTKDEEQPRSSKSSKFSTSAKSHCTSGEVSSSSEVCEAGRSKQDATDVSSSVKADISEMPGTSSPSQSQSQSDARDRADTTTSSASSTSTDLDIKSENSSEACSSGSMEPNSSSAKEEGTTESSEVASEKITSKKASTEKVKPGKITPKGKAVKLGLGDDEDFEPELSGSESEDDGFESDEAVEGSSDSEEESEDSEEDDEEEMEPIPSLSSIASSSEEPGKDSGTTAVVALLNDYRLIVANSGDSRCVLCRDEIALDMSHDHKPEDKEELSRINSAGGYVSGGRVNGGLNLSRAIGDHCYKKNKNFDLDKQVISAMPDVKEVTLRKGDKFMVLACDGIWNTLSSQDVVNFVLARLPNTESKDEAKLSVICEDLMTTCLAADTTGDGTGCDNMTCIIVKFNEEWLEKSTSCENVINEVSCDKKVINPDMGSGERADTAVKTNGTGLKPGNSTNSNLPLKRPNNEENFETIPKKQKSA